MRLLWLGLGVLGGMVLTQRNEKARGLAEKLSSSLDQQGERWSTRRGQMASSAYGAGSASLEQPDRPMSSTAYSAGTASLPMDQQEIRDPNTVR